MKILTNLSGACGEADYREPGIHHPSVGDGATGLAVRIGPAGIVFTNGKEELAVPMVELWKLAARHEPKFLPAKPA